MSQSLARIESTAIAAQSLADMQQIGKLFAASKMFTDVASEAQAVVKIMAGAELGLSPFAAMAELHVVKGKVTLSAGLLAKKVKASGRYNYKVLEHTDKICSIDFLEHGEKIGNETFTIEQARKAGVQNLEKYPKNMLFARAISNGVRFYCPDVTGQIGVYTDGEITDEQHQYANVTPIRPQVIEAQVISPIDDSYVQQINALIQQTGWTGLAEGLNRKGLTNVAELPQEDADKLIKFLMNLAAKQAVDVTVINSAQWACTTETNSGELQKDVEEAQADLIAKGILTDEQIKAEVDGLIGCEIETATAKQVTEVIDMLLSHLQAAKTKGAKN